MEASLQTGCKAKGFRFRYEDGEYVVPSRSKPFRRKVVAIGNDGKIVMEFDSAYDAADKLGVINAAVYWALNESTPRRGAMDTV